MMRAFRTRAAERVLGIAVLAAVIAACEIWTRVSANFLFPPPSVVFERARDVWFTREFLETVRASLARLDIGFTVGAALGIAIGAVAGAASLTSGRLG